MANIFILCKNLTWKTSGDEGVHEVSVSAGNQGSNQLKKYKTYQDDIYKTFNQSMLYPYKDKKANKEKCTQILNPRKAKLNIIIKSKDIK